jgi:hypothetical protein
MDKTRKAAILNTEMGLTLSLPRKYIRNLLCFRDEIFKADGRIHSS